MFEVLVVTSTLHMGVFTKIEERLPQSFKEPMMCDRAAAKAAGVFMFTEANKEHRGASVYIKIHTSPEGKKVSVQAECVDADKGVF